MALSPKWFMDPLINICMLMTKRQSYGIGKASELTCYNHSSELHFWVRDKKNNFQSSAKKHIITAEKKVRPLVYLEIKK